MRHTKKMFKRPKIIFKNHKYINRKRRLEDIIKQAERDYKEGRYIRESVEEHFKRIKIN